MCKIKDQLINEEEEKTQEDIRYYEQQLEKEEYEIFSHNEDACKERYK
jgi:hypothetical protein